MDYLPEYEGAELFYTDDKDKAKQWFEEYVRRDEKALRDSREVHLYIEEVPTYIGIYLRYNNVEFPARYVKSIKIVDLGKPPSYSIEGNRWLSSDIHLSEVALSVSGKVCAIMATSTRIEVKTISGNIFTLYANRHIADQVLSQLLDIWRQNR